MGNEYRESWDKLSEVKKNQIIAESKYQVLDTQYQIDNFWQTRDLRDTSIALEKINESNKHQTDEKDAIGDERAQFIIQSVKRMNGQY
jgi:hypothetical protein